MRLIQDGSEEWGRAFEHFLIEEIRAYLSYRERHAPLAYWRTSTGLEVDLIVGQLDLAVEFKASRQVDERHLKGLRALMADQDVREAIVVSQDAAIRELSGGVTVYPWREFCGKLWGDGFRTLI